jgi:RNA polymerase sigma-70 factor (ECF subfamily)
MCFVYSIAALFLLQSLPFSVSINGIKSSLRLSNALEKDLKKQSDEELLRFSRGGHIAAFGELVRRYESKVAATVIGMLGQCDEADDIGQETFIRFYNALKSFRGDSSIGTYITRIAMNLSLNEIRRRERRRFLFKRIDHENELDEPAVESGAECFEEKEIIRQAMETLSPKFRAVVNLRLAEGYSTEETAGILHIPVGTVLSRLQRAQKKLQSVLKNYKEGF